MLVLLGYDGMHGQAMTAPLHVGSEHLRGVDMQFMLFVGVSG